MMRMMPCDEVTFSLLTLTLTACALLVDTLAVAAVPAPVAAFVSAPGQGFTAETIAFENPT